jgi:hypothetical protein
VDEEVRSSAGDADESDCADAGGVVDCGIYGCKIYGRIFCCGDGFEFAGGSGSGRSDEAGGQRN